MGKFNFSVLSQFRPPETMMRHLYREALAGKEPPDRDAEGIRILFAQLNACDYFDRLFARYPDWNRPETLARFREDFGFLEASEGELGWMLGYLQAFRSAQRKENSALIPSHFREGGSFQDLPETMDRGFDLRMRIHDRYMPVSPHSHDFFELVILVRGSCRHMVGDDYVQMTTGDIVVVPPNTTHWLIADDDESIIFNMHIRRGSFERNFMSLLAQKNVLGEFFNQSLYAREDTRSYLLIRTGDYFLGDNVLADIHEELRRENPYQADLLNTLCKLFFLRLLERYSDRITTSGIAEERADVAALMRTIQESGGEVTMEELCERFSYSSRQLSRLISQYTGSSLRELRKRLRIERAGQLLRDTRMSVEEISAACGYPNLNHFYTAFKELRGVTPVSYRRRAAESDTDMLRVDTGYALGMR